MRTSPRYGKEIMRLEGGAWFYDRILNMVYFFPLEGRMRKPTFADYTKDEEAALRKAMRMTIIFMKQANSSGD